MDNPNNLITPTPHVDNGKTAAIVCYITFIGWLIAYLAMYKDNKTVLAGYHLRQSLLLNIIGIGISLISRTIWLGLGFYYLLSLLSLALLILLILGIVYAAQGEMKAIPLVGAPAQKMFSNI